MSDDTQNAWVERVLGIAVPSSSPQDADAFADLGELGIGALDIWTAARGAFDTANEAVDQQITTLVAALHASDDPELQEIGDMGLNGLTENVKVPLIAALIEAGTANIKTVAAASPKVLAAVAADVGRGGEKDPPTDPAIIFAGMLDRLESDPLWAREYEDFVRQVSFANPQEMVGFVEGLASCRRLVASIETSGPAAS